MPHVVLNGDVDLDEIFNKFKGVLIRSEQGVLKTDNFFISNNKTSIIIESLVIENSVKKKFFTLISKRDDGVVVRLYPGVEVEKTPGVKNLLSKIAMQLLDIFPQLKIGETNLIDYLK